VLLIHVEVEGEYPYDRSAVDYGGAVLPKRELHLDQWSYVALGHYHTQHQVANNAWYAGSLEYVGPNIWGEWVDEKEHGGHGKGWLLIDLDRHEVTRMPVPAARGVYDLDPVLAEGLSAAGLDQQIRDRIEAVAGGIADKIIRLRVFGVPRHVAREMNHSAIRGYKAEALHFHLDLRRPETHRVIGTAAPGRRQTLPDLVASFLAARPLPAELDRDALVHLGRELMDQVERDLAGG
jgi:exonuclease SbcD